MSNQEDRFPRLAQLQDALHSPKAKPPIANPSKAITLGSCFTVRVGPGHSIVIIESPDDDRSA